MNESRNNSMNQIIVINKPQGLTSQAVDTKLKKILHAKHIGHLGTLDPLATGVLVVMVDGATKLAPFLESNDKKYLATICLGLKTDTLDITGQMVEQMILPNVDLSKFDESLTAFQGEVTQTPPIYSAIKVDGKKLYEYARQGKDVTINPRKVYIYNIKRTSELWYDENYYYVNIEVACSKGTYIRSLIDDLGKALGIPACMSALCRLQSGKFTLANAVEISDVEQGKYHSYQMQDALNFPIVEIDDPEVFKKVSNGMKLSPLTFKEHYDMVAFTYHNELIAIYQFVNDEIPGYHPMRVWLS